ncbi:MAG: hypothetical protein WC967_00915 [Balneolaceae bacterium]
MHFLYSGLILLFLSANIQGQSLSVSSANASSSSLKSNIDGKTIVVQEGDGVIITKGSYNAPSQADPSVKSYSLQNGGVIVRENIANFLVYNSFGKIEKSVSNSTQSKDGESISELAADVKGKTVVLYNTKVMSGSKSGSRAKVLGLGQTSLDVFYSDDRTIRTVRVAESGEFIAIATAKEGTDDEVTIIDRYGNQINTIKFDQEIVGMNLYGSGSTLTVFSNGRVAVYDVLSGNRLGGSSFRDGILRFANYSSADKAIIGLTGDINGDRLSNIEVRVINIGASKIAKNNYSGTIQFQDLDAITLTRTGRFNYTISGMDKDLKIRATF